MESQMNAYGVGMGTRQVHLEGHTRRNGAPPRDVATAVSLRFGRFELDEADARLTCDGSVIDMAPRPFAVLCALARRPGALLTKDALLDEVWGHRFVTDSVLKTVVGKLRTTLGDDARDPRVIETVARRGYRFIATTSAVPANAVSDPPAVPAVRTLTPERALREIRELLRQCTGRQPLLLLLDHPEGADTAVAGLMDYIARWSPDLAANGTLSAG